ncbi:MAG: TetR/AcrR family transcriptional regulator [Bdellovibrionales bacterium]|nr:TetR/AcrR family transcriptional regulator [Bdellovibrionales bacterium]
MKNDNSSVDLSNLLEKPDITRFSPRERILAAALKLFVEQGYFNTNVPDLSRDSKCSVGSIYHNFKNKEEVARALYEEGISAFRKALYNSLEGETDPEKIVRKLIISFLRFSELNHQLSKYLWLCRHNEFMSGMIHHPTRVGFDPLGRKLTSAIKEGMRKGKIRKLKAHIVWSVVFGIPVGYVRDWLDGYNKAPPGKVAETLADSCWRSLRAD